MNGWVIGRTIGARTGLVIARETVDNVQDVVGPWRAYSNNDRQWYNDASITVNCTCIDSK